MIGRCDNCPCVADLHPIQVPYGSDREERETLHVCDTCDPVEALS